MTALRQRLVPYLYVAPALTVACVFSFVSMGISLWVSFHDYDAFAGASGFVGLANYERALFEPLTATSPSPCVTPRSTWCSASPAP